MSFFSRLFQRGDRDDEAPEDDDVTAVEPEASVDDEPTEVTHAAPQVPESPLEVPPAPEEPAKPDERTHHPALAYRPPEGVKRPPPREQKPQPPPLPSSAREQKPSPAAKATPRQGAGSASPRNGVPAPATVPAKEDAEAKSPPRPSGKHGEDGKVRAALQGMDTGEMTASVDDALSEGEGDGEAEGKSSTADLEEARRLFEEIAADYMTQARNVMLEVQGGEAPLAWLALCEPSIASLRRMATKMGLDDLAGALGTFAAELRAARSAGGKAVAGEAKEKLLRAYTRLAELAPTAFKLDGERDRREPIIIDALLRQVPRVGKLTLDRLYRAGLGRLDRLLRARADEMAAAAGIRTELAEAIESHLTAYRESVDAPATAPDTSKELRRLGKLLREVRETQSAFERAAAAWSQEALEEKKRLRRERERLLLAVQVSLARLGELERLAKVERLPCRRKLGELTDYVDKARRASLSSRTSKSSEKNDEIQP